MKLSDEQILKLSYYIKKQGHIVDVKNKYVILSNILMYELDFITRNRVFYLKQNGFKTYTQLKLINFID
jgi:hypothetical protein